MCGSGIMPNLLAKQFCESGVACNATMFDTLNNSTIQSIAAGDSDKIKAIIATLVGYQFTDRELITADTLLWDVRQMARAAMISANVLTRVQGEFPAYDDVLMLMRELRIDGGYRELEKFGREELVQHASAHAYAWQKYIRVA